MAFRFHLVNVLAGHRKRKTRILHVVTTTGQVVTFVSAVCLLVPHPLTLWVLLGAILAFYVTKGGKECLAAAVAASSLISACSVLYTAWLVSRTEFRGVANFLVYLAFGVPETLSHKWFDDGDQNLVTQRRKPGFDKICGVLIDVILTGPLVFVQLGLTEAAAAGAGGGADFAQLLDEANRRRAEVTAHEQRTGKHQ
jgi:hypothetical protein